jgi:hypothetical protein
MRRVLASPVVLALGAALLVAYPALRFGCDFHIDWTNHKWLTAYFGEFFRQHLRFPVFVHTREVAGMAYPLFYGFLFYPLLGSLSILVDVDVLLRAAALLLMAWQVLRVRSVASKLGWRPWPAIGLGGIVVWAIYPVTNLFLRSALTEFFAYGLLVGALTHAWEGWLATEERERRRHVARAALAFTISAGTHPVTAVLGGLTLALVLVPMGLRRAPGRRELALLAGCALLSLLALSPWLWAVATYGRRVAISRQAQAIGTFRDSIGSPLDRLLPFAFDRRMTEGSDVETPFLCAQVSLPLIVLWLVLGNQTRRRPRAGGSEPVATAILAGTFALMLALSLGNDIGGVFAFVQFAYRFVNYVNFVALAAVFWYSHRGGPAHAPALMAVLAAWAGTAGAVHAMSASRIAHDGRRWSQPAELRRLPPSFYGAVAYVIADVHPEWSGPVERVRMPVGRGAEFGVLGPGTVTGRGATWACLQVQSFPWARLFVDGRPTPDRDVRRCDQTSLAVHVGEGPHQVEVRYDIPAVWRVLRWTMWAALLALAALSVA